jgi:hypothetical protein
VVVVTVPGDVTASAFTTVNRFYEAVSNVRGCQISPTASLPYVSALLRDGPGSSSRIVFFGLPVEMGSGGSSAHPCVVVGLSDFWTSF